MRSLREPEVQALLNRVRPGWRWEPMLLEVEGERVRVYAGLAIRAGMLLAPGASHLVLPSISLAEVDDEAQEEVYGSIGVEHHPDPSGGRLLPPGGIVSSSHSFSNADRSDPPNGRFPFPATAFSFSSSSRSRWGHRPPADGVACGSCPAADEGGNHPLLLRRLSQSGGGGGPGDVDPKRGTGSAQSIRHRGPGAEIPTDRPLALAATLIRI